MNPGHRFGVWALGAALVLACAAPAPPAAPAPATVAAPPVAPAPATAAAAAVSTPGAATPAPAMVTVRIGIVGSAADAGVFIAQERGYFHEEGIDLETTRFQALQQQVPLLGTGQLDIGGGGVNAGLLNAVAQEVPLRIVADKGSMLAGFRWQGFVVRQDVIDSGSFAGCASFRGMRVANAADGNSAQIVLERLLGECGLSLADIELVVMGYPDMPVAFRNGAIEASHMLEPGITRGAREGLYTLFRGSEEIYPGQQNAVLLYGPPFMAERREAAQRFMVAYVRGLRAHWEAFTRGTDKAEILDILNRSTGVNDRALIEQMAPTAFNPDGYVQTQTLADDIEWWVARGYARTRVDVAQVVDNSFVDYAIARLGRYTPR